MRLFSRIKPSVLLVYFICVIGTSVFLQSPHIHVISLFFAVMTCSFFGLFRQPLRDIRFYTTIMLVITLSNPLFVTKGSTAIFYINNRPYTLEALLYGLDSSISLLSAIVWFRCFSEIFTSEKIGSLLGGGALSSVGTVFTLTMRWVPSFKRRYSEIRLAQRTAGFFSGDTFLQRIRSELNVFFTLAVSSLELSAGVADSMRARGSQLGGKTFINRRNLRFFDVLLILLSVLAMAAVILFAANGRLFSRFYPSVSISADPLPLIFYSLLCAVPSIFQVREVIKWHCSK
ncbi:MAG: energy-coupling factor transporter transmembrane component T family protein [Oscillospiraceae bacterium]